MSIYIVEYNSGKNFYIETEGINKIVGYCWNFNNSVLSNIHQFFGKEFTH